MSDPLAWPALAGIEARLGEVLQCEVGIFGKVHGQASDYRWIARSPGFGTGLRDIDRHLRIGSEDLPARVAAWRAPWDPAGQDWLAVGAYPSRAIDAAGRGGVLEKRVLHWRRPSPGFPVAAAALALLPEVARGDDRPWWDRVREGDWERAEYALPLAPDDRPRVRIEREALEGAIDAGIRTLSGLLARERLAALYAALLAGERPVLLGGLDAPLPPEALAALLLPLSPEETERLSLCAWVPSVQVDPRDLGRSWDLAVTRYPARRPPLAPEHEERGAAFADALLARDPGRARAPLPGPGPALGSPPSEHAGAAEAREDQVHPVRRMHLPPTALPGLRYLHRFADRIDLRRLDLGCLRQDLETAGGPHLLAPGEDPDPHPLLGWIHILTRVEPAGVDTAEWGLKIAQLRAAALFLLPHPRTLGLVGLPEDPAVPALLCALAWENPDAATGLAAHGEGPLRELVKHTNACRDATLVAELRAWMSRWCEHRSDPDPTSALGDPLRVRPPAERQHEDQEGSADARTA